MCIWLKKKMNRNKFGELVCTCGCEIWDHGSDGKGHFIYECLSNGCTCKEYRQKP